MLAIFNPHRAVSRGRWKVGVGAAAGRGLGDSWESLGACLLLWESSCLTRPLLGRLETPGAALQQRIGAHGPTTPSVTHRLDTATPAGSPSRGTGGVIEGNLGACPPCSSRWVEGHVYRSAEVGARGRLFHISMIHSTVRTRKTARRDDPAVHAPPRPASRGARRNAPARGGAPR